MFAFPRSALLVAAAYAALAITIAAGALTGLDQWAVDHLMPGSNLRGQKTGILEGLVPFLHQRWNSVIPALADVITFPAGALVSLLILIYCRDRVLVAAWIVADAIELLCKTVVQRPTLFDRSFPIAPFDSSFPSGHALRTVLVAAAVAAAWPRLRPWALAWAVASIVLLLLAGWHTPTDLAGGILLGVLALLCARAAGALRGGRRLRARA